MELIRYVWKPERPTIDHTEKKHTTTSNTVTVQSRKKSFWTGFINTTHTKDHRMDSAAWTQMGTSANRSPTS